MSSQKTTFRSEESRKLIESARLSAAPLKNIIGTVFKLEAEHREVSVNRQTNERIVRDVVDVRTLNSQLLPVGTMLQIKMKNVKPLLSKEDQQSLLLGSIQAVVGFEDLLYWSIGISEGLTASSMFISDLTLQDAIGMTVD